MCVMDLIMTYLVNKIHDTHTYFNFISFHELFLSESVLFCLKKDFFIFLSSFLRKYREPRGGGRSRPHLPQH
jgi:hypothetical protein